MADWYFEKATTWEELVAAHEKWALHYNYQKQPPPKWLSPGFQERNKKLAHSCWSFSLRCCSSFGRAVLLIQQPIRDFYLLFEVTILLFEFLDPLA